MSVCVTTYTLAADLVLDAGLSVVEALVVIGLGNLIILVPMILNAHPGTKYGIPFPVLARASFGVVGANIPAMMRAFVACGWFGIQTWIGGKALYQLHLIAFPGGLGLPNVLPEWVGLNSEQAIAVLLFWLLNVYFILKGTESIKWLESLSAPLLIGVGLALLWWAYDRAGGFGAMFSRASKLDSSDKWMTTLFPVLTGMVGYWSTVALNIPDFSRYARGQREQAWGQALGLPTTMVLYAFIGVAVTSVSEQLYGKALRDPIDVVAQIGGTGVVILSMVAISVATLTTNLAANVVSPANDFSNLAPHRISYKAGGMITAVLGMAFFPWKVYESHKVYIETWLIGYAMLLAPITAILIVDYFLLRKRELNVDDLYREDGEYRYTRGFNLVAIAALVIGIAPNLPGFLNKVTSIGGTPAAPTLWDHIYNLSWFVGFAVGGAVYLALSVMFRTIRKPDVGAEVDES
jgi:NCS1 family nucleobase:cation symporter-1